MNTTRVCCRRRTRVLGCARPLIACLLALLWSCCALGATPRPKYDWEDNYGYWRHTDTASLEDWVARTPRAVPQLLSVDALNALGEEAKTELFHECLVSQAKGLAAHVLRYRSPALADVTDAVSGGRSPGLALLCCLPPPRPPATNI
jgi:hypothetical protein